MSSQDATRPCGCAGCLVILLIGTGVCCVGILWNQFIGPKKLPSDKTADLDSDSVCLLHFNAKGGLTNQEELERLIHGDSQPPTDIVISAHGWLHTPETAEKSYKDFQKLVHEVPCEPRQEHPPSHWFSIGICWPSMGDPENTITRAVGGDQMAIKQCLEGICGNEKPDVTVPDKDTQGIKELLKKNTECTSPDFDHHVRSLVGYFDRWPCGLAGKQPKPTLRLERKPSRAGHGLSSIKDIFRYLSYWRMKKRAALVGELGVRALLRRKEFREARIHLIGHSLGCKLLLASLASDSAPAVESVVLLQPAISTYAFAAPPQEGGYNKVLSRVKGPLVVTFSDKDMVLKFLYRPASWLTGDIGEVQDGSPRNPSWKSYSSAGAVGIDAIDPMPMCKEGKEYKFKEGLYNMNASAFIPGHGKFANRDVAWLVWSALSHDQR